MTATQYVRALVALKDRVASVPGLPARHLAVRIGHSISEVGGDAGDSVLDIFRELELLELTHRVCQCECARPQIMSAAAKPSRSPAQPKPHRGHSSQ
ncbi:MAG: hypothetical protein HUU22_13855 [Phycisphaerae bacterium]|nr:hypothetical protein [Phycisphaerae bacterium]NUQ47104.1 hypothetical protein [Phycisphaerae bacterium]